jgi:hypothetical protein
VSFHELRGNTERFGGSYSRDAQEKRTLAAGVPPEAVARRVVQGMRDGVFYIVTDAGEQEAIRTRHRRIEAAFDAAR